ncbi:2-C-methyl-D-erythritol 2,4-cyclodiphosphate synthase, chloroplastic-like [Phoenix dactylifera]|uniref:2-C-methyl-D-erythritol 2,4-cyclodiphosphate synthase n=1 Tax=Phoenix dactylifera TaxID=42345 RepID=A0A8B7CSM6_PHODC|nr:2-C-methyl-D-erythritol 2,4-cyclodiphosphate synthase, chloroplastic-like [Phoenix dactylifera]XP_038976295.1 2-C-methyl-D-erythritol 2,4-cyclodiphosphate synthase, chloroplastic-like [Phoenix dactylifera]
MASSSVFLASPILPSKPAQRRPLSLPSATSLPSSISAFPRSLRRPPPNSRPLTAVAAVSVEQQDSVKPAAQPSSPPPALPFRIGHGFDLHRLEPGLPLIIGGIDIPHDRGCEAHSDGDVLLHCVVDAILGALGLPDIGQIFPDSDPKWRGAASSVFVREAVKLMHEAGYELGNLDATLILQKPKLSPHKEAIRTNLCDLLGANPSVINLKAKTHEKVDSLGENRSIAAHTVVLLMRK